MGYSKHRGFTLIELLVVISIIALLSSVVLASVTVARMKARDAHRMSDLHQITIAVAEYYSDHGYYPGYQDGVFVSTDNTVNGWVQLQSLLAPYMKNVPVDPVNNNTYKYYFYSPAGNGGSTGSTIEGAYDLLAWTLEDHSSPYRCELHNYMDHEGIPFNQIYYWCVGNSGHPYLYSANP